MTTENPIAPVDSATPALSDDGKAKAEEHAQHAAEHQRKHAPAARYLLYTVPQTAAAKVHTRPSGLGNADGSLRSKIGYAVARAEITAQQWKRLGFPNAETTVWDGANDWRLPAEKFTGAQIEFLLVEDRKYNGARFELVDGNGKKVTR